MRGFSVSGLRATISPPARRTNSLRTSCAACAASGAVSGLTTSWQTPVWSRRSTNTSPPWSRRRAAQPARVTRRPASSARGSPQPRSRQGIGDLLVGERAEQPLEPGAEPDRRRGRPADLLDEVVVAAAAADRALRADRLVHELERRTRVVVEPADERRRELVAHAVGVEVAADGGEVLAAGVAERLADLRRVGERRLHLRALHVEDAERRRRALLPRFGVEDVLVLVEPRVQALDVRGPALAVADRVEL